MQGKPEAAFRAVRAKDAAARFAELRLTAARAAEAKIQDIKIAEAEAAEAFAKTLVSHHGM